MTEEVESILNSILLKKGSKTGTKCRVCFGVGTYYRPKTPEHRFCSDSCHKVEHLIGQIFPLGMKRLREEVEPEEMILRLQDLPPEIQALIILSVFHFRLEDLDDWSALSRLKLFVEKRLENLIEKEVIPRFRFVDGWILNALPDEEVVKFRGIREFQFGHISNLGREWNSMLGEMNQLVSLSLITKIGVGQLQIELSQFVKLTRLVTGTSTENDQIRPLTRLTALTICSPFILDEIYRHLTNLTKLDIGGKRPWKIPDWSILKLDENALLPLVKLEKLSLNEVYPITGNHLSGLTQLTSLHLESLNDWLDSIETLTNLKSLVMHNSDTSGHLEDSLGKLTKLEKLTIMTAHGYGAHLSTLVNLRVLRLEDGEFEDEEAAVVFQRLTNLTRLKLKDVVLSDGYLTLLTNLRSLSLYENLYVTDQTIASLTTLTYLNLQENWKISTAALRPLVNLRFLKEFTGRLYPVNNGEISLFLL